MTARLLIAAALVIVIAVLLVLLGRSGPTAEPPSAPPATPAPSPASPLSPRPTTAPVRHRLAGVAVGPVQYVVIESPDGTHTLYRLGEEVPGLGEVTRIDPTAATFEGPAGSIRLDLAPAATLTRPPRPRTPTRTAEVTAPTGAPAATRTAGGSSP